MISAYIFIQFCICYLYFYFYMYFYLYSYLYLCFGKIWDNFDISTIFLFLYIVNMIGTQESKNLKLNPRQIPEFSQKSHRLDLSHLAAKGIKQLYPAVNNTFICVCIETQPVVPDGQNLGTSHIPANTISSNVNTSSNLNIKSQGSSIKNTYHKISNPNLQNANAPTNMNSFTGSLGPSSSSSSQVTNNANQHQTAGNPLKKVVHFTSDCQILGELVIKEQYYELFMLNQSYVTIFQYSDKKTQSSIVQWSLQTYETIVVNYNRQILPMVKLFAFSQSQTFCIVQHDQYHDDPTQQKQKQTQPNCSYHTKFKLAYFKFPLKKTHQKPYMVFKTHTNPKEYGYHQQIMKLNDHSMIGSVSSKTNQNDETLLKTFDFRNNSMGIQVNYKFHVQINYRKELLQLWIRDIWEIRPQHFYLKYELIIDRNKEQKFIKLYPNKINQTENLQECINLTWAYKNQNTLKFAKFKTPLLSNIQFFDGFNKKSRVKTLYQKSINKQKISKIQPIYQTSQLSLSSLNPMNSVAMVSSINSSPQLPIPQIYGQKPDQFPTMQLAPIPTYLKSINKLPIYYINNYTEEIVSIERQYFDWQACYPAYAPRTVMYYKIINNSSNDDLFVDTLLLKVREIYTSKEIMAFWIDALIPDCDFQLVRKAISLVEDDSKKDAQNSWKYEMHKSRQIKSKSNIEVK